ncbi:MULTISPECIES: MMPL family transporter [unclassified Pseudofrankia]|uniref:MMPL family transporter n=1 Tax=unclassified Pseudofrankia TaxID=2994372 RepID=UPI0008DA99A7|nr:MULTISPECIES: MMPL family transporter [unclassified Pseudofrankia]MDT3443694.1 MMPL family transporter [Pseudofrankia sp. BMG5.37]OHV42910.1 hypothetical protein BCD48_29390 [Pseudofrankia sp. BMG5.36]
MSGFLHRLGGACAAHPWRVIGAWVAALVLTFGLASVFGGTPQDNYDTPGLPSQVATDLLRSGFPEVAGADARIVLHDRDSRLDDAVIAAVSRNLAGVEHVDLVTPPRLSADGDTALITAYYDRPVTDVGGKKALHDLVAAVAGPTRTAGVTTEIGGQVAENIQKVNGAAEAIGIAAALVILLLAFGSVVAAGVPLAVALIGLGVGSSGVTLIAAATQVSTIAPTLGTMVGLGVGIDYALLLVTRHVEGLRAGLPVREAAARATATSGTSVLFAGATVVLALMGLRLVELKTYSTTGFTTAVVVVAVVATSLTLVPALCGLTGYRLLGRKTRRALTATAAAAAAGTGPGGETGMTGPAPMAGQPARQPLTARWAARVGRRPLPWALGALGLLLALAAPVLDMRTWPQDAGSQSTSLTQRRAYDLIAAEFGPGANGPLLIAADLRTLPRAELDPLAERIRSTPDVADVAAPIFSADGSTALLVAEPAVGPSDPKAAALVRHLRADVLPGGAEITGWTASFTDISALLADQLWEVVGFVVGVSVLLLLVVFRSPLVAVKAAVMNMLSIAAAYGVIVAVFQWGWGAEALGLPHAVPMSSWLPLLMFAVLFGLSMDYEVFLLSRIREDWLATGDARGSVTRGLARTGRVITSAGLIMIAVFAGFALDPDVTVKMLGLGMAVAVLVDMTVIRMVLVPATMALLGRANWWLPRWLDRILPHLDLHGGGAAAASTVALPSPRAEPSDEERAAIS